MSEGLIRPNLLTEKGDAGFNHNPTQYYSLPTININRGRDVASQPYKKYRVIAEKSPHISSYAFTPALLKSIRSDKIAMIICTTLDMAP